MPLPKRSKNIKEMKPPRDESNFNRTRNLFMPKIRVTDYDFLISLDFNNVHCKRMSWCSEYRQV